MVQTEDVTAMNWVVEHGSATDDSGPYREPVASVEELDMVLDRIDVVANAEGFPAFVMIMRAEAGESDPVLSLGLGRPEFSFLTYDDLYAHGDLDGGKPTDWMIDDQWSTLPPNFSVDVGAAREAAREFLRTDGQKPTNVEWSEYEKPADPGPMPWE